LLREQGDRQTSRHVIEPQQCFGCCSSAFWLRSRFAGGVFPSLLQGDVLAVFLLIPHCSLLSTGRRGRDDFTAPAAASIPARQLAVRAHLLC
jgi:hypothetical protein